MGLPSPVAAQLRATPKIDTLELSFVLQIARALMLEIGKDDSFKISEEAVARSGRVKLQLPVLFVAVHITVETVQKRRILSVTHAINQVTSLETAILREMERGHCVRQQ